MDPADSEQLFLLKIERDAIDAVAQSGRFRAIVEDMAEMSAAVGTSYFGTRHPSGTIDVLFDASVGFRCIEAGPATAGIELSIALEERRATATAPIDAIFPKGFVLPGEGTFGPLFAHNTVFFGGQIFFPFGFGFHHRPEYGNFRFRVRRICSMAC